MQRKTAVIAALLAVVGITVCSAATSVYAFSTKIKWHDDGTKDVYYTYNTGAVHCVNDETDTLDFKIDKEYFDTYAEVLKNKFLPGLEKDFTESKFGSDKQQYLNDYGFLYADKDQLEAGNVNGDDEILEALDVAVSAGSQDSDDDILEKSIGYLIQKDFWTPPGTLSWSPMSQTFWFTPNEDSWQTASQTFLKSDLIMMLSKIEYGVQRSVPLVWRDYTNINGAPCWATGTLDVIQGYDAYDVVVDENGDVYHYCATSVGGDIFVYWSPNVYELYINQAVKAGLVEKPVKKMQSLTNSGWQYCGSLSGTNGGKVLGSTISVGSTRITEYKPKFYGKKEHMTLMNALRLIENFMRVNESDMSDVEEQVVRYKLNLYLLDSLPEEDRSTLTYLIAKGVVDYSNANLVADLRKEARYGNLLPVLYRVADKSARLDFSEIQLTDSDKQWQAEGFYEQALQVSECEQEPYCPAASVQSFEDLSEDLDITGELYGNAGSDGMHSSILDKVRAAWLSLRDSVICVSANARSTNKTNKVYTVKKTVDKANVYVYKGVKVSTLYKRFQKAGIFAGAPSANKAKAKLPSELDSITDKTVNYNGKEIPVYELTFSIESSSEKDAVLAVDNNFKLKKVVMGKRKVLAGVTRFSTDDGDTVTMISQESLKQCFTGITVLEDKVLMNTETGAMAYLSGDQNFALVGNSVITSDYKVIYSDKSGKNVYYNLDVLLSLLPKTYIKYIGSAANLIVYDIMAEKSVSYSMSAVDSEDNPLKAVYLRTIASNEDGGLDDDFSAGRLELFDGSAELNDDEEVNYLLKLNSVSSCINTLTKDFSVQKGKTTYTGTIIVDWQYAVPSINEFNAASWFDETVRADTLTYQEALSYLTTPPVELGLSKNADTVTPLQQWWESNYGMSNALCNYMYGTSGLAYVSSGYLVPSVTVLLDADFYGMDDSEQNEILKCIFQDKVLLGDDYLKYNGGRQGSFWKIFYGFTAKTNANNVYPGLSQSVQAMAANNRTFSVYTKTTAKKSTLSKVGDCYGRKYFVADSGAVYLNLDGDDTGRFGYTEGTAHKLASLFINTRKESTFKVGGHTLVKFGNMNLIYLAVNDGVMNFLPQTAARNGKAGAFATKGHINYSSNGKIEYVPIGSSGSGCLTDAQVRDLWMEKEEALTGEDPSVLLGSDKLASIHGPQLLFSKSSKLEGLQNGDYVYDGNKVYKYTNTETKLANFVEVVSKSELRSLSDKRWTVYGVFYYRFPQGSYFIAKTDKGSELCKGRVCAALNFLDVEYASLNSQLIESKLCDVQGVRTVGSLQKGTKLIIGDTVWVRGTKSWKSKAIQSENAASRIIEQHSALAAKDVLFGSMFIRSNGADYSLANYVESMSLGTAVGSSHVKNQGILCRRSGENGMYVFKNGKYKQTDAKSKVQYISLHISLNKNLLVRPLDAAGSVWTIVYQANIGMESSDQYPFFDDGLSFNKSKQRTAEITASQFSISSAFISAKNSFMQEYHKALIGDYWSLLWLVLLSIASYMIIMSWFCYGVLTLGVGRFGFEALAMRDSSGKTHGIDVIKLFTFGVYSLDSDPSLQRVVTVSVLCCCIIVFIFTKIL